MVQGRPDAGNRGSICATYVKLTKLVMSTASGTGILIIQQWFGKKLTVPVGLEKNTKFREQNV